MAAVREWISPWPGRLRPVLVLPALALGAWPLVGAAPGDDLVRLLLCFAGAAILLLAATGRSGLDAVPLTVGPRVAGSRRRVLAAAVLGSLVGSGLLALALFYFSGSDTGHPTGWALYLGALAALVGGFAAWGPGRRTEPARLARWELGAILLVLAIAVAFRCHELGDRPYGVWFDEAENALISMRILEQPQYRPVFVPGLSQMPAMLFYYYAVFIQAFGPDVVTIRLATTVLALLAVALVWLLARELFGARAGIAAAALLAICRWHVTFSRFAMAMIVTTVFIPLALLLFQRSQRRLSPRLALLAGLTIGVGLQFYYSMLTLPLIVALVGGHGLLVEWDNRAARLGLIALTLAAALFAYAPLMLYASEHPREFSQRVNTVSIIKAPSLRAAVDLFARPSAERDRVVGELKHTLDRHARMFHLVGDNNGRHNLPGHPMLDPVTGLLFAIGLLWAVALVTDPRFSLLLLWFGAMMASGVLTLAFEAPQGARTFGSTAVIAVLASLPIAAVCGFLAARSARLGRVAVAGAALAVAAAALENWTVFFERQLWDPAAWASYSTPQTKIAEVVRDEGGGADVYVVPVLSGTPTFTFVRGAPFSGVPFNRGGDLPLADHGRPALVFFEGNEDTTAELIGKFYPNATLEGFGAPRQGGGQEHPILRIARIPAADIGAVKGWKLRGAAAGGETAGERSLEGSEWDWRAVGLGAAVVAGEITGTLRISQDGAYEVELGSDPPATLAIDGERISSAGGNEPGAVVSALHLARGNHLVAVSVSFAAPQAATPSTGPGRTGLRLRGPGLSQLAPIPADRMFSPKLFEGGLLGKYSRGRRPELQLDYMQIDPQIAFYFHFLPLPRPFTIEWSGSVLCPTAGRYRFGTKSIDGSEVVVEGAPVAQNGGGGGLIYGPAVELTAGPHDIQVTYEAVRDYSQVYLYWVTPGGVAAGSGGDGEPIPPSALRPVGPIAAGKRAEIAATRGGTEAPAR
ncbi:MAG: glycosyltransferase family 39 protein [Candidatus Schekmanbacteria bacterium]|nr:glycosyltransferase family 39 protein [Candidatus Schekmanbacteria bacterium]